MMFLPLSFVLFLFSPNMPGTVSLSLCTMLLCPRFCNSKRVTMPPRPVKPTGKKAGKSVRIRHVAPRELYIRACAELGLAPNSGLIDLLSMYQESASVEFIDVSRNYLGDKGVIPLLAVVDRCNNLREISLSENGLRNNAIAALCNSAVRHPSLRRIDVSDNYISEGAAAHLQRLLEDNPRVCELGIDNTKIDVEWRLKLRDLLRANATAAAAAAAAADVSQQDVKIGPN
ncbi:hypothetical protein ECC02_005292 [Trypanosoma cruzi]|uniref:Uncharacterized protein n=3 Tax=Trypanosoma cruzi TaxID=5693 RepID=Q4DE27_TRYCC|nr:hypothetical protein, conserved [Trypanosoma cruzi]EAN90789.1 hypothetical protein, conserved [Trypanosoma cruzi]KAF5221580.1 hypothetical protein ECC02_005292 [Trypanosoma cruzi]|eukprot:XP_812640.1 hypothetical protein [Trypanosoma cruzi strain CL Brener]